MLKRSRTVATFKYRGFTKRSRLYIRNPACMRLATRIACRHGISYRFRSYYFDTLAQQFARLGFLSLFHYFCIFLYWVVRVIEFAIASNGTVNSCLVSLCMYLVLYNGFLQIYIAKDDIEGVRNNSVLYEENFSHFSRSIGDGERDDRRDELAIRIVECSPELGTFFCFIN